MFTVFMVLKTEFAIKIVSCRCRWIVMF